MSDVQVRPARPEDVPAVEALVAAAYGHYVERIGMPPLPMVDDYRARVDAGHVWVVDGPGAPGDLLGLVVLVEEPNHLYVDNVAVAPHAQGAGLGRRLLTFAEERAVAAGLGSMRLMTHELMTENRAIYAHLGWREVSGAEREGRRAVVLVKAVTPTR